jgi:hypothetical protein
MKTIKWAVLPATFFAAAAMLGGCVDMELDEQGDGWVTEPDEQADEGLEMLRLPVNPETALVSPHAPIRKGYAWNAVGGRLESVQYAEVDGLAVVEGDMIIGTVEEVEARTREVEGVQAKGVAIDTLPARWPNAVVPYTIDPTLPNPSRVTAAINAWEQQTHVRFVLRTASNAAQHPDWVTFRPGLGCASNVGRIQGQQMVILHPDCNTGNTIHEIGHALGLWHEQSRGDRDTFVRILWANIADGMAGNFDMQTAQGADHFAYDYGSIMHYGTHAFSRNNLPTIETLGGEAIGQRVALSNGDVATIRRIYSSDDPDFFVQQTYHDVLKRSPDRLVPGDLSGFRFFLSFLQNCNGASACLAANRVAIARAVLGSEENIGQDPDLSPTSSGYNSAFITHCYTNFLRRQPSAAEHSWWLNNLNASGDYSGVVNGFITSAEYRQRFGMQ